METLPYLVEEQEIDLPPSYDASLASAESSSHQPSAFQTHTSQDGAEEAATIPDRLRFLFSRPSNAELPLGGGGSDIVIRERIGKVVTRKNGKWIESWDHRLSDPDVLCDFIRFQSSITPKVLLRCRGEHFETYEHDTTVLENGTARTVKQNETRKMTDFDFTIDLSEILDHPQNSFQITLSTAPPWYPAKRGTSSLKYASSFSPSSTSIRSGGYHSLGTGDESTGTVSVGKAADYGKRAEWQRWEKYRMSQGIPVWVKESDVPEYAAGTGKGRLGRMPRPNGGGALQLGADASDDGRDVEPGLPDGSGGLLLDLRGWCRAYCKSTGLLKEFIMKKELSGWDQSKVIQAVKNAVISTGYNSNFLHVSLEADTKGVVVRPNNTLSRALGNGFIYFITWITLIYPLLWLLKYFLPSYFGAPWEVSTSTYALKSYPPLPSTYSSESLSSALHRLPALRKLHSHIPPNAEVVNGPKGVHFLLGRREGAWFREWEERIKMGVRMRYQGALVGGDRESGEDVDLDGY